ncbi:unnamed protein product [Rotaria sordida]|uniref:Aprataxin n=1 Tax=Rotaria sordida TaxID=392033 RepID=A0A819GPS3_9BILA|nr:unnamed protein product [Rotaria sordida]
MASSLPSSTAIKRNLPSENLNENQPKRNHWSAGLSTALDDEGARVHKDELCTVIKDKYPKARIHLLVMPNEYIANLKSINNTHLPLLKHMLKVGKEVAEKIAAKANARGSFAHFRYGYHAIPSMSLLHMHKKHWNSFTSDYFLDASQVIDDLQANGSIHVDTTRMHKLLDNELQCHRCSNKFTTMPKLKQHLLTHTS